jgi:ATP-binding cassette, subfamily B, bacterial
MFAWAIYHPAMYALGTLGILIITGFGGWLVMEGRLTPGELVSFVFLLGFFYEPIGKLHNLNQLFQSGRAAADRVFAILDAPEESHMDEGHPLRREEIRGHVRFEGVTFSYAEAPTLRGISLEALPGQTIALVGTTGAGKSTVISLLTRFYEYDGGSITIDGHELRGIAKPSLRDAIGYVTQEAFLFNGSVRENLALGDRDAGDDALWQALEAANAAAFTRRLPQGIDTVVGERGVKLSVGERQRLSIARALLKNPPLLLLDEATASVDTETERLIQQALERLMANRTAFVIAHRLSTVRNAHCIYVLAHGAVVEQGTHDELLARDGTYATLARRDFLEEHR